MKRVILSAAAQKQIGDLTKRERERIEAKLDMLERTPSGRLAQVKTLKGENPPMKRLRVGDYRVLFREDETQIDVLFVAHHKDVYD